MKPWRMIGRAVLFLGMVVGALLWLMRPVC